MATVSGIFEDFDAAQAAVERLVDRGVPASDISIIGQKERVVEPATDTDTSATATGLAAGAAFGALGGLLIGLSMLTLPVVGPVLVAGPLATTLAGTALGAATGGLLGAILDLGVPEEQARTYVREMERGYVLVVVRTTVVPPDEVRSVLVESGATKLWESPVAAAAV